MEEILEREKADEILRLSSDGALTPDALRAVMARKLRVEKVAIKRYKTQDVHC